MAIKIKINLATRKYPGTGLGLVLPVSLIFFSAVLSIYLSGKAMEHVNTIDRLEKKILQVSAEMQHQKQEVSKEIKDPSFDLAAVTDILEKREFSWIGALDNLERAIPTGISLSSIQPSFKDSGVQLTGHARDFAILSRFIDNLEKLKVYKRVFLINQSVKMTDDEKKAIVFNISIEGKR